MRNMSKRKPPELHKPGGRPSTFSEELADEICARIASGRSVSAIEKDADMPTLTTMFRWMSAHPWFRARYEKAMELRAHRLFEQMLEIADTPTMGETVTEHPDGSVEVKRGDMAQHRRLQVDTRKWVLARMLPKVYGEKLAHEVTGQNGGALTIQVVTGIDRNPGDDAGK